MPQINTRLVLRNDTKANWEAVKDTATLKVGEFGVESDTGLFKIGKEITDDGTTRLATWAELEYANAAEKTTFVDDESKLPTIGNSVGDVCIVKKLIEGTTEKYSYTAYVWQETVDGENWAAMDGNYSADNIYFDTNFKITTSVGAQVIPSGQSSKDFATKGKNLTEVFTMLLAEEKAPKITSNPTATIYIGNGTSSSPANNTIKVEGGSTVTPKWSASLSAGSYSYGPATGITASAWDVKGYLGSTVVDGHTSTSNSGTFGSIVLAVGDSYKVKVKATHNAGVIANTNFQQPYQAGNSLFDNTTNAKVVQIAGGTKEDDSPTITAWQQGYYIGWLENDIEITSDILRNVGDGQGILKDRKTKGDNYAAMTDYKWTTSSTMVGKKFVIAYPQDKTGVTKFFNNTAFEEYSPDMQETIVKVAGADNDLTSKHAINYVVKTYTPGNPFTGSKEFLISLG